MASKTKAKTSNKQRRLRVSDYDIEAVIQLMQRKTGATIQDISDRLGIATPRARIILNKIINGQFAKVTSESAGLGMYYGRTKIYKVAGESKAKVKAKPAAKEKSVAKAKPAAKAKSAAKAKPAAKAKSAAKPAVKAKPAADDKSEVKSAGADVKSEAKLVAV